MTANYCLKVMELLKTIESQEKASVLRIAAKMVDCINSGGIVYVFGSGHSSILTEEAFHRAGGLIPVYPVLHGFLSPHTTPRISGKLERLEGVAPILFQRCQARPGDLFWIASNSGVNSAAIEMAQECRKAKIDTVAVTSVAHSQSIVSRHSSGSKLFELASFVLDNHCPPGDALTDFDGVRVGAGSTIANAFLWNWVLTESCNIWKQEGKILPIYRSANLPGGDSHNEKMEMQYIQRIPLL